MHTSLSILLAHSFRIVSLTRACARTQDEIKEECAKTAGAVEKVTAFAGSAEGVVAVKFRLPKAATKVRDGGVWRWWNVGVDEWL